MIQGCYVVYNRIDSESLVLGRSVNLGALKMLTRSSKPKRSGLIDESPYFIGPWENPSAILLRAHFCDLALRRSGATLERMIVTLPFEPYAAVYRQLWGLVRAVNQIRKAAGYAPIAPELRKWRRTVRPFASMKLGQAGESMVQTKV